MGEKKQVLGCSWARDSYGSLPPPSEGGARECPILSATTRHALLPRFEASRRRRDQRKGCGRSKRDGGSPREVRGELVHPVARVEEGGHRDDHLKRYQGAQGSESPRRVGLRLRHFRGLRVQGRRAREVAPA